MEKFIITVSRGYGSGGRIIGKKIAEELNIAYYDNEILKMASEESGINESLFAKSDDKINGFSFLRSIPKKPAFKGELIPPDKRNFVSEENLFNYQAHILRKLAMKESFVVIGRAADYVLDGFPNLIKIHVHSPFEDCVKTIVELFGFDEKEAAKRVRLIDKQRADFYKYYTASQWDDPKNYDLVLNTARIGWDNTVELVKDYVKLKIK